MLSSYQIVIKSPEGEKRAQIVGAANGGFMRLAAALQVNAAGRLDFDLRSDNPAIEYIEDDSQVELWRNGVRLFRTLYQGPRQYTVDEYDRETFTAICYGEKDLLNRAIIAWPSNTENRTIFTDMAAESILHTLVHYNVTADATTANGRLVTYPDSHITVENDLGYGEHLSREDMAGKPLLAELQEIANLGGVDFDLIQTGPRAWVFRVFPDQRGVDRSSTVVFSRSRKNINQLAANVAIQDPRSVIIVGGQGQGTAREFVVRYGPDYSVTNHREYFESYSGESMITALMQARGDQVAQEKRLRPTLSFVPLQVSGTRYGIDYDLGDIVSGTYRDITATYQIFGVSLSAEAGKPEDIAVELKQR